MSLRGFSLKVFCWAGCVLTIASASAGGDSLANLSFTPGQDQLQLQLASHTHYQDSDDYEGRRSMAAPKCTKRRRHAA